ncbi:alpha/beta fold hydrolase [Nonomuraea sp. bgisy101]|uniref:alpha/beta hydrolase n=1 Tax=Nonomuraea sp. bgisy101 TaxID=3413784 RepID=UPI003D750942
MNTSFEVPLGQRYQVGERRLFLHRSGTGGPAVVFLPGASALGLDYLNVHDRISAFTTSVLYDRAGTGWSDPAGLPRPLAEVASELRLLLQVADVAPPYVLAAHSLGGAYARRFLRLFPDEVAGVVYLDSFAHEEWDIHHTDERLRLKPQPVPGTLMLRLVTLLSRGLYRKMFATWPSEVRDALIAQHLTVEAQRAGALERSNQHQWGEELKAAGPVPGKPAIVLTAPGIDAALRFTMPKRLLQEMTEGKIRMHRAMAASVADGEHRVLPGAKHSTIGTDCPDEVVQAIFDLWRRVR